MYVCMYVCMYAWVYVTSAILMYISILKYLGLLKLIHMYDCIVYIYIYIQTFERKIAVSVLHVSDCDHTMQHEAGFWFPTQS